MIVMKFGGTSVQDANAIWGAAAIIRKELHRSPLVVVSACAGVTNALARVADLAAIGELGQAKLDIDRLLSRHIVIAEGLGILGETPEVLEELLLTFAELTYLVESVAAKRTCPAQSVDSILAFGERWSSHLLHHTLVKDVHHSFLIDATSLLITDAQFTRAVPNFEQSSLCCNSYVVPLLRPGSVTVTQGFIGATPHGETTTIGRGGSDYSASIFGSLLDAEEVQIWTDTDGILTADPAILPEAKSIPCMSYDEAAELSLRGARVIHPSTVQPLVKKGIPLRVLNSKNPTHPGTFVRYEGCEEKETGRPVSIILKAPVAFVRCDILDGNDPLKTLRKIQERFGNSGNRIAVIAVNPDSILVCTEDPLDERILLESADDGLSPHSLAQKAIISLVGLNIRSAPRLLERVISIQKEVGQHHELFLHSDSDHCLSIAVDQNEALPLLSKLHGKLVLNGYNGSLRSSENPAHRVKSVI